MRQPERTLVRGLEHKADPHRLLAVGGLTYAGVPVQISPREWTRLLRDGTPSYAAQPYQQLAAGYRALGDDRLVRTILTVQRDDHLARTSTNWVEKSLGQMSRITIGYGYQPVRLVWWLSAVVALSCVLAVGLGAHGALTQTDKTATPWPTVHGDPGVERRNGSQPAVRHQSGPGRLRPGQKSQCCC